jgi:hypothetical protein
MNKPKPTPGPKGTNSFGRTYEEQSDYEKSQRSRTIGSKDTNPLMDFIGGLMRPKLPASKPMAPGSKSAAAKKAAAKKAALKKMADKRKAAMKDKSKLIPASPTN